MVMQQKKRVGTNQHGEPYTDAELYIFAARWMQKYGNPPTARDWRTATDENPTNQTVIMRFGSWNKYLEKCNLPTRGRGRPRGYRGTEGLRESR